MPAGYPVRHAARAVAQNRFPNAGLDHVPPARIHESGFGGYGIAWPPEPKVVAPQVLRRHAFPAWSERYGQARDLRHRVSDTRLHQVLVLYGNILRERISGGVALHAVVAAL